MKKAIGILLALALVFSLAGCAATDGVSDFDATAEQTSEPSAEVTGTDFAAIYAGHEPEAVVMTVGGSEVTWAEFFYWCHSVAAYIEAYMGAVDYSAPCAFDETQTYGQYITGEAVNMVLQYHSIEVGAAEAGIALTDADKQAIAEQKASDITTLCGEGATEDDLYAYLAEQYVTPELYEYFSGITALYTSGFDQLYGENGKDYSDKDAMSFAEENGYMTAKHILISTVDAEGAALDDAAKAEKKAAADDLLAQITAVEDQDERLELFDKLMNEKSEDPGLASYPDGYCFTAAEMVEEFSTAAAALEDYGVSDVVESSNGYHIILRLPTTPDTVIANQGEGAVYDLRYVAASAAYDTLSNGWMESADVVWDPAFEGYAFGV